MVQEKDRLSSGMRTYNYAGLCKEITDWKRKDETSFLKLVHSQRLQQTAKDLDRALKDAFAKKKCFPRFKKKGQHDSFRYPQGFKFSDNKIFFPKVGWVKYRMSCQIQGSVSAFY